MVTGAELLNEKWEALSDRFNLLKSVPRDQSVLINAAIADWQDWFWGPQYGNWDSTELLAWQDRYVKAARLLDAAAAQTTTVSSYKQTDDYKRGHANLRQGGTLPPLLITARPPAPAYVPPPPVVYQEKPYLPPPPKPSGFKLDLGPGYGNWEPPKFEPLTTYSRDPGTTGWTPTGGYLKVGRGGLIAAMVAVGAAIVGKKQGWL